MAQKKESEGTTRTMLLAALVIAATAGAMVMVDGDENENDKSAAAAEEVVAEDDVLRVSPVIVGDKIVSASWRDRNIERQEGDTTQESSMLDEYADPFGEKSAHDLKVEKSLRETVDQIHGLGVYVAPADEDDK